MATPASRAYSTRHKRGTMGYLAGMLLLFPGLRRSDAVRLGRQHFKSKVIRFKTSKTGSELVTDVPWPLEDALAAMPETGELAILLSGWGKPFASGASFYNWFKDRCLEAKLPDCSPHGLRKGGATIASENSGSDVELDAMYGWSNQRQSGTYTKKARNRLLATKGFDRIAEILVAEGILEAPAGEQKVAGGVAP
jgi:integrase